MLNDAVSQAVKAIVRADSLIITAGAGMGVDSGLPDFRGSEGFWRAYPALKGKDFTQMANPAAFKSHPQLAWGFYGHRLNLYRATQPHSGFTFLKRLAESMVNGYQIFTSNVDGQFQRAGFDEKKIFECHGSIHHLQCARPCSDDIWSADFLDLQIDQQQCLAVSPLPYCPQCQALARPNVLMFGDFGWNDSRAQQQARWLNKNLALMKRPVIIECGAGTKIPTVRHFGEHTNGTLIRINPRDAQVSARNQIALAVGAKDALELIERALARAYASHHHR